MARILFLIFLSCTEVQADDMYGLWANHTALNANEYVFAGSSQLSRSFNPLIRFQHNPNVSRFIVLPGAAPEKPRLIFLDSFYSVFEVNEGAVKKITEFSNITAISRHNESQVLLARSDGSVFLSDGYATKVSTKKIRPAQWLNSERVHQISSLDSTTFAALSVIGSFVIESLDPTVPPIVAMDTPSVVDNGVDDISFVASNPNRGGTGVWFLTRKQKGAREFSVTYADYQKSWPFVVHYQFNQKKGNIQLLDVDPTHGDTLLLRVDDDLLTLDPRQAVAAPYVFAPGYFTKFTQSPFAGLAAKTPALLFYNHPKATDIPEPLDARELLRAEWERLGEGAALPETISLGQLVDLINRNDADFQPDPLIVRFIRPLQEEGRLSEIGLAISMSRVQALGSRTRRILVSQIVALFADVVSGDCGPMVVMESDIAP